MLPSHSPVPTASMYLEVFNLDFRLLQQKHLHFVSVKMPRMTRWRFVIQNNAHGTIRAKVVNVQLRLVRLLPCLGKEQQRVTKVTAIGRVIHCPNQMSGGIDNKIDFHFNGGSRLGKCHLVVRYCDSQGVIGARFTGITVGLGIESRSRSRVGFLVIHCGKGIRLV